DAHWGDRAEPSPGFALEPFVERIAALPRVGLAVELGCSVGRVLAELPAERAVGVDMHFGAMRRARRLLAGHWLAYARREIGRHYSTATATGKHTADRKLVCADALDPPLLPDVYDRVVALNVLDSVAHPRQLLSVIDGLCKHGGEIIVSSPYAWQSSVMLEHERFGGADPAAAVRAILTGGTNLRDRYRIEDESEIAWTLRRDARSSVTYRSHYIRARKGT
ncbi:MAG TPA: methyltransferase domain-containing protein, partial [Kofleriaceae bacterium]